MNDDSPGLTHYPRRDIETHRSVAKWNTRFALVLFIATPFIHGTIGVSPALIVAFSAFMWVTALSLRQQALRWETEFRFDE